MRIRPRARKEGLERDRVFFVQICWSGAGGTGWMTGAGKNFRHKSALQEANTEVLQVKRLILMLGLGTQQPSDPNAGLKVE